MYMQEGSRGLWDRQSRLGQLAAEKCMDGDLGKSLHAFIDPCMGFLLTYNYIFSANY